MYHLFNQIYHYWGGDDSKISSRSHLFEHGVIHHPIMDALVGIQSNFKPLGIVYRSITLVDSGAYETIYQQSLDKIALTLRQDQQPVVVNEQQN